ncbi:MAG: hypothetical protein IPN61_12785 [Bacteroidetes bacterium]|nr:hypothetical protein [Bacteroidota bacterium]
MVSTFGTTNAQVWDEGTNILGASVGIGSSLIGTSYSTGFSQTPGLSVAFDHGMGELGNGVWSAWWLPWIQSVYLGRMALLVLIIINLNGTYTIIGVRGAYHFPLDNEKLDLYLGAMLSYNMLNF